jgi:hypothetical protein
MNTEYRRSSVRAGCPCHYSTIPDYGAKGASVPIIAPIPVTATPFIFAGKVPAQRPFNSLMQSPGALWTLRNTRYS